MATPMKKIRILALGTVLVLSFVMGAQAQTGTTSDPYQPTTQSEDTADPDQQPASESEQATPSPEGQLHIGLSFVA
jgi:hypothetical protein